MKLWSKLDRKSVKLDVDDFVGFLSQLSLMKIVLKGYMNMNHAMCVLFVTKFCISGQPGDGKWLFSQF